MDVIKSTSPIRESCRISSSSAGSILATKPSRILGALVLGEYPGSIGPLGWGTGTHGWSWWLGGKRETMGTVWRKVNRRGRWKVGACWTPRWAQLCGALLRACPLMGAWSPLKLSRGDNLGDEVGGRFDFIGVLIPMVRGDLKALDTDESEGASDEGQRPKPLTTSDVC